MVHDLFQLEGQILLLELSFQLFTEGILVSAGENIVFDQLLGQGAAAARAGLLVRIPTAARIMERRSTP